MESPRIIHFNNEYNNNSISETPYNINMSKSENVMNNDSDTAKIELNPRSAGSQKAILSNNIVSKLSSFLYIMIKLAQKIVEGIVRCWVAR